MADRRARGLLLLVACWLVVACGGQSRELAVGAPSPRVDVVPLDGSRWEPTGRPVLVSFWATWCAACKAAMPELRQLAADDEIEVLGLALDSDPATVTRFAERHALDYVLALDDGALFERFDGLTIPHSVLVGADRQVLAVYRGVVRRDDVVHDLERVGGTS